MKDMKELLEKNLIKAGQIGKIIEGIIIGKGRSAVFLDLGAIGTGTIYGKEYYDSKILLKDLKMNSKIGSEIGSR